MPNSGAMAQGLAEAYMDGAASVPYALLRTYRALQLTDTDCMLLIQLIAFRQLEKNDFPTMEQLQVRLGASGATVAQSLQQLIKRGLIAIDEVRDPHVDFRSERYNLTGLYKAVADLVASGEVTSRGEPGSNASEASAHAGGSRETAALAGPVSLYRVFEQEFGRPLTPMEVETIGAWLDQDRYAESLVLFALKESVFAGKLSFRYIDRILLEWSRNRVSSVEEARAHAQRFRSGR